MDEHDSVVGGAHASRRAHIETFFYGKSVAADDAREGGDTEYGDCGDDVHEARAEDRDDGDGEKDAGKGEEYIRGPHDDLVEKSPEKPAYEPQCHADDGADSD